MNRDKFLSLIGKDFIVYYPFMNEIQQWNMKNFYIDENGLIKHRIVTSLITDIFIEKAYIP